tara:strand:+ start:216 stop:731 length:516 start_codon:yes stop_codon:yes gene_type:complete
MNIVLLGYMGCGKSTIGKKLALERQLEFFDLDDLIENQEGQRISKLFETKGELYFRKQEAEVLRSFVSKNDNFVLALGGGTPCYANNTEFLLEQNLQTVYLKAQLKTLVSRLQDEKAQRPLISRFDESQLTEFIAKHLFERRFYYEKAAVQYNIDEKGIEQSVLELEKLLF